MEKESKNKKLKETLAKEKRIKIYIFNFPLVNRSFYPHEYTNTQTHPHTLAKSKT